MRSHRYWIRRGGSVFRGVVVEACHRRDSRGPPFYRERTGALSLFPPSASPSELIHPVNQLYLSPKAPQGHTARAYSTLHHTRCDFVRVFCASKNISCVVLSRNISYFFRHQEPAHHRTSTPCVRKGYMKKEVWKFSTISKRKTWFRGRQPFGRNASFIKNSRSARII